MGNSRQAKSRSKLQQWPAPMLCSRDLVINKGSMPNRNVAREVLTDVGKNTSFQEGFINNGRYEIRLQGKDHAYVCVELWGEAEEHLSLLIAECHINIGTVKTTWWVT